MEYDNISSFIPRKMSSLLKYFIEVIPIIGFLFAIYFLILLVKWFQHIIVVHKEKVRDQVWRDLEKEIDINNEIKRGISRLILLQNYINCGFLKKYFVKPFRPVFPTYCPICRSGRLRECKGKFGIFIGCSHYPNCSYSSPSVGDQFIADIKEAYNLPICHITTKKKLN